MKIDLNKRMQKRLNERYSICLGDGVLYLVDHITCEVVTDDKIKSVLIDKDTYIHSKLGRAILYLWSHKPFAERENAIMRIIEDFSEAFNIVGSDISATSCLMEAEEYVERNK